MSDNNYKKYTSKHNPDFNSVLSSVSLSSVTSGFASPVADSIECALDLNKYLIANPISTFFMRASNNSMIGAGVYVNDLLIVDRSLDVKNKSIVIAIYNGELVIRRFYKGVGKIFLRPENKNYQTIIIREGDNVDFEIWGVVTNVIRTVK